MPIDPFVSEDGGQFVVISHERPESIEIVRCRPVVFGRPRVIDEQGRRGAMVDRRMARVDDEDWRECPPCLKHFICA